MKTHAPRRMRSRDGFTLIEILIVVTIIAILIGMLLSAVMKVLEKIPVVKTKAEMSQLEGAIQAFMAEYNVNYIPSRIRVCRMYGTYASSPSPITNLDHDSIDYIQRTIGRNQPSFMTAWQSGIQWTTAGQDEILEGHQCLVFFLGGIQTGGGGTYVCNGFPANPSTFASTGGNRKGPFFAFQSQRLSPPPGKTFCAYADAYDTRKDGLPRYYAYFSSRAVAGTGGYMHYGTSDCASLNVLPYASSPAPALAYVNSTTWQIISSGADGIFGPGTDTNSPQPYYWNSGTAAAIPPAGQDDQANFATGKLRAFP